jgi:hypothetical protein
MQTLPSDPNVADFAPEDPALTSYDEQHVVTYMRLLQADSEGLIGARSLESCCMSIQNTKPIVRVLLTKVISRAPSG